MRSRLSLTGADHRLLAIACSSFLVSTCGLALAAEKAVEPNRVSVPAGVVHIEIPARSQALVSLPLEPPDDSVEAILGAQLSPGDQVLKWNSEQQAYQSAFRTAGETPFWSDVPLGTSPSALSLLMGDGVWIVNAQESAQTVFFTGELALEPTKSIPVAPALNLLGFPYSTGIAAVNTSADDAGRLLTKGADGKYLPPVRFDLGQGYWYWGRRGGGTTWTESRPYAAPFPTNGLPPQITEIVVLPGGESVRLRIAAEGASGENLDVLYQDVTPETEFKAESGWMLAASGLPTAGQQAIEWNDNGAPARPKVKDVFGRFYLVARGDLDSDQDGIPDGRERFVLGTQPLNADSDGDGITDGQELASGTNPLVADSTTTGIIHVSTRIGDDRFDGNRSKPSGLHGPKKTIRAGFNEAVRRHSRGTKGTVVVQVDEGTYRAGRVEAPADTVVQAVGRVEARDN